ncbi:hypothetical protein M5689_006179 [Euphorbia peplus]|nr:hypothetical protein M5689_006179 [Euphorbia peplus]
MGKMVLVLVVFFLALILHSKARTLPTDDHATFMNNDQINKDTKETFVLAPAESPTTAGLEDKKNFIYGGVGGFAGMGGYAGMIGGMPVFGGVGGMGKYGGLGGVGGLGGLGGGSGGLGGGPGLGGLGGPGLGGGAPAGGGKGGICP